eukprot:gene7175-49437_t
MPSRTPTAAPSERPVRWPPAYGVRIEGGTAAADDRLRLPSTAAVAHPWHSAVWDQQKRVLEITGDASISDPQCTCLSYGRGGGGGALLRSDGALHIEYDAARDACGAKLLFGAEGYLATITSAEENADSGAEGEWRWIAGCEGKEDGGKGLLFWKGRGKNAGGSAVTYAAWSGHEPNQHGGGEDYAEYNFTVVTAYSISSDSRAQCSTHDFPIHPTNCLTDCETFLAP